MHLEDDDLTRSFRKRNSDMNLDYTGGVHDRERSLAFTLPSKVFKETVSTLECLACVQRPSFSTSKVKMMTGYN